MITMAKRHPRGSVPFRRAEQPPQVFEPLLRDLHAISVPAVLDSVVHCSPE
jgi:hypothetical protein